VPDDVFVVGVLYRLSMFDLDEEGQAAAAELVPDETQRQQLAIRFVIDAARCCSCPASRSCSAYCR